MSDPRPRRPARRPSEWLDQVDGGGDPATVVEVAHATAATIVGVGRAVDDPETRARLVALVQEVGIGTLAELWAGRPARSLPGTLWRLYVLREWLRRDPAEAAADYQAGVPHAEVSRAIAGVAEPPGPDELLQLADQILGGVYGGDLALGLERAAAFTSIVAVGRAHRADAVPHTEGDVMTRRAANLTTTACDLAAAARLWRGGSLD